MILSKRKVIQEKTRDIEMILFNKIINYLDYILSFTKPKINKVIPALTGNQPEDFVRTAEAMCGKNGQDFGWRVDWCVFFICWAGRKSHAFPMSVKAYPFSFTVEYIKRKNGEFYCFEDKTIDFVKDSIRAESGSNFNEVCCKKTNRESFLPEKGDIILFHWREDYNNYPFSHIGIVNNYKDGIIETIEGNTSDNHLVKKRMRDYDTQVIGFLRTNWQKLLS